MKRFEPPDQFMYNRQGPWPQPSPSYPLLCAEEVLHIPAMEQMQFNATIGTRYLQQQAEYAPAAAMLAIEDMAWEGPTEERFGELMFETEYTRYIKVLDDRIKQMCEKAGVTYTDNTRKYDFSAMRLITKPLEGTYIAPTVFVYEHDRGAGHKPLCIFVNDLCVRPDDKAWPLARLFVMQGAAYHVQFVVHPALHFPMDAVNAITKTAVPVTHPLFQLLMPHSTYQLALNHAVQESAESVVNNNAQGTRFDPLTADAYQLKVLFGAGYAGLPEDEFGNAYPAYDYMSPQKGFDSAYGEYLDAYFKPFETFCGKVADYILADESLHEYAQRWMHYSSAHVLGFPGRDQFDKKGVLAKALAIYMWDCTVSHAVDHANFAWNVLSRERCLRLRIPPPKSADQQVDLKGKIATVDDYVRTELCTVMFFTPFTLGPNLLETTYRYAFTNVELLAAAKQFREDLIAVSKSSAIRHFMPLRTHQIIDKLQPDGKTKRVQATFADTLPASIQY